VPVKILFPAKIRPESAANIRPDLAISEVLHRDIIGFLNAAKGFPKSVSGSFLRMFYFSAVTITTLGYGDIVPITNGARITLAIESILGIILIGLFVNSLFQERKV
jgi:voltage-gated potassium channel Kch